jgi:hypothetical protein
MPAWNGRWPIAESICITAATDTLHPLISWAFLASLEGGEPKLLVARSEEGVHPVFGLWPVSLALAIETSLAGGMRKVQAWVREHQAEEIFFPSASRRRSRMRPPVFGIAGWKNSGKTTMAARLVTELTGRGYAITAIKHAHESFDIDHPAATRTG